MITSQQAIAPNGRLPGPTQSWSLALGAVPLLAKGTTDPVLDAVAPLLVDSCHRETVATVMADRHYDEGGRYAGLVYARGYLKSLKGDVDSAIGLLAIAQSLPASVPLTARISAELGYLFLSRGQPLAAEAILAAAQGRVQAAGGTDHEPDLLHLAALIADWNGDRKTARHLYQQCLEVASRALTPLTRVLALSNLAVALAHQSPEDAISLGNLAIATVAAEQLNERMLPMVKNAVGYAAMLRGRLDEANAFLTDAADAARAYGNRRIECYAAFNLAVREELLGYTDGACQLLRQLIETVEGPEMLTLQAWAQLRLKWLAVFSTFEDSSPDIVASSPELETARKQLAAIQAACRGEYADARRALEKVRQRHAATEDDLSLFVTDLWLAHVESHAGRDRRARDLVSEAAGLGRSRGFALSTNWWTAEIVATARSLADDADAAYIYSLRARSAPVRGSATPAVHIRRDGSVLVAGSEAPPEVWREGKTGPYVLRRLFHLLCGVYPEGVNREALTDELWPDSDGDRAIRNLYAATHDLRRVLASIPGVLLVVSEGSYRLQLSAKVTIERRAPAGR